MWRSWNTHMLLEGNIMHMVWQSSKGWTYYPHIYDPVIPLPGMYPREMETPLHKNLCVNAHRSPIGKHANNPNLHQQMNGSVQCVWPDNGVSIQTQQKLIHGTTGVNLENLMLNARSQTRRDISAKIPSVGNGICQKTNPQRQKGGEWLPGAWAGTTEGDLEQRSPALRASRTSDRQPRI